MYTGSMDKFCGGSDRLCIRDLRMNLWKFRHGSSSLSYCMYESMEFLDTELPRRYVVCEDYMYQRFVLVRVCPQRLNLAKFVLHVLTCW